MASELQRIARLAAIDSLTLHRAENHKQRIAWGGAYALFIGDLLRYASDDPDNLRAWLHVNAGRG